MIKLMSFLEGGSQIVLWVVLAAAAAGLFALLVNTIIVSRRKKNRAAQNETQVDEHATISEEEYVEVNNGRIVMSRNVMYSAGLNGQIRVGKYMLTSADESQTKFNVRYNGLVKEYSDGDVLTLTDGDTISPVSGSVVLSRVED